MEKRRMGKYGLEVPALCLGTMTFGLQVNEADSRAILDRAYDHRLIFLDTSDAYPLGGTMETMGETEAIIGRWMKDKGNRDNLIVATKCFAHTRGGLNNWGLSRQHIMESVEKSLRRLGTDHIDLYQSHGFDPHTPLEETLRAFEDLITAGKVRYVGASNVTGWQLQKIVDMCREKGYDKWIALQVRHV